MKRDKGTTTLFEKLTTLINEHGIERILTTLEDAIFIKASNEHLKGNERTAKRLKRISNRIRKIKIK